MKILKSLSLALAFGALALTYGQANAAQQSSSTQVQGQRTQAAAQPTQRRTYRSYSYSPSYGRGFNPGPNTPTWSRADSKVKFRYGYYPY